MSTKSWDLSEKLVPGMRRISVQRADPWLIEAGGHSVVTHTACQRTMLCACVCAHQRVLVTCPVPVLAGPRPIQPFTPVARGY